VNRLLVISFALVLPFVVATPASQQKSRRQRNRPPSIESFTSSLRTIQICPFFPTSAISDKPEVQLIVEAADPDGDTLHYEYSITEGTISGKGSSVLWNLDRLPRGPHEVRVIVTDGKGGKVEAAVIVTTVDSSACDPPPPPCPVIKVSCAEETEKSKPFIFSVSIEKGAEGYTSPSYRWKVNAGRIVKGQYTPEIEATTTGANGFDKITATVEVDGVDLSCSTIVSCSTKIIW
jgi:hypothetical protein